MHSLCMSRLLFNVHVLVLETKALAALNQVYMRMLRRIGGAMRFSADCGENDLQVRQRMKQASLDCILLRKRLHYAKRLLLNNPLSLLALLQAECKGARLKWTLQLADDLRRLASCSPDLAHLGDPVANAAAWASHIRLNDSAWTMHVDMVYFETSILDKTAPKEVPGGHGQRFACTLCPNKPAFASSRALGSHNRAKHGQRCPARKFVGEDATCPICKTLFVQRIRAIAHLSDSRRTKCMDAIRQQGLLPLSDSVVARLDEQDKLARRDAQRCGSSHVLATGQAKTAEGKSIGHVKQ